MINKRKGHREVSSEWYKENENDQIWWLDNGEKETGVFIFSFDKKKKINLFADYPHNMTKQEIEIFDKENPFWADFFKDRK